MSIDNLNRSSSLYNSNKGAKVIKRLPTLDLFRGVAALSVMLLHYIYSYRIHYGQFYDSQYDFRYGYLGVQFFFIISGFVIFLTVLQSKSVFDFLYKRMTRLYPTFLFCLAATYLLVSFLGLPGREKSFHTAVWNITMIPGFFSIPAVDGAYWSLVPEVFFYILMVLVMLSKQLKNILVVGCIFLALTWVNSYIYKFPLQWKMALNTEWNPLFFAGILFYKLKFENARKSLLIHLLIILCFVTVCQVLNSLTEEIIVACFFILFYLFSYDKLEWLRWKLLYFLVSFRILCIYFTKMLVIYCSTK
jgi:peptidoglycan/LPS O-acetylase OafA/YrhL